jgi:predicted dinucleotide-binding enzyme
MHSIDDGEVSMRIAVIGAGNVGGTLGRRWAERGHDVAFGMRDPARGASAVKGGVALPDGARVATVADAVRGAEVVLLATPWKSARDALGEAGADHGALDGKTILDTTNPLGAGLMHLAGPKGESGAEQIQAWAPNARVVKIFNTTGFENMQDPVYDGAATVMFYAGDDAAAKAHAHRLATDLGFEAIDVGALVRARELEHLAVLWISLAFGDLGRNFAFRVVRR